MCWREKGSGLGAKLGEDAGDSLVGSAVDLDGHLHVDGLLGVDGDGVEGDFAFSAEEVEDIEEIFDANIVCGEGGWIVAGKARRGAGDGADGAGVGGGIDHDDAVGQLQGFEEDEASSAAVEALDMGGQVELREPSYDVYADSLVTQYCVAQPQHQCFWLATLHASPVRTSIHRRWMRWYHGLQCSHDRRTGTHGR